MDSHETDGRAADRPRNALLIASCIVSVVVACSSDPSPADADPGLDGSANVDDGAVDAGNVDAPSSACADDVVTGDSLEAARSALAKGTMSVSLSPKGCLKYERVVRDNVIVSETFIDDGSQSSRFLAA